MKFTFFLKITSLLFWLAAAACSETAIHETPTKSGKVETKNTLENKQKSDSSIPNYVYEVLEYIKLNNEAPIGYVGGRAFKNREKQLPKNSKTNRLLSYREWDVHPKVEGQNRGAERLVTDDDGNAYYTNNHYKSFIKINY